MTTREEQWAHFEALEAELADMFAKIREIGQDRDLTSAWLEGYDLGYATALKASPNPVKYYTVHHHSASGEEIRAALSEIDKQLDEGGMP